MRFHAGAIVILASLVLLPSNGPYAQESVPLLTLAEAVGLALANNERVIGSRESVAQARLGRNLAASAFGTQVTPNVLGSFGQSDVRNQTYGVGASRRFTTGTEVRMDMGAATFRNQIGNFYAADTTLLVSQPLLRGFGPAVGRRPLERADHRIAIAERQHGLTEQQLAIEVAGVYYRLIAQRELARGGPEGAGERRASAGGVRGEAAGEPRVPSSTCFGRGNSWRRPGGSSLMWRGRSRI